MRPIALAAVLPLFCLSALAADNADGRPMEKDPFPVVDDWSTVHIQLERGSCAEACPVYSINIDGDGSVTYIGEGHVLETGRRTTHISTEKVRDLVKKFQKAEFFWTFTFYEGPQDAPLSRLSISLGSRQHAVADQGGAPKPVAALFDAVDKAAGAEKWVIGDQPKEVGKSHNKAPEKPAKPPVTDKPAAKPPEKS